LEKYRLFADDCVIYKEIKNNNNKEKLQRERNRLGKWEVENAMKINSPKHKAYCFTRARVKGPLNCTIGA
jgi:hypothetical protein